MSEQDLITGRARQRTTSRSVRWIDRAMGWIISIGGIGTIVAVLLVCVFLISVAIPLFGSAEADPPVQLSKGWSGAAPLLMAVDEYRLAGWTLMPDGRVHWFRLEDGQELAAPTLLQSDDATEPNPDPANDNQSPASDQPAPVNDQPAPAAARLTAASLDVDGTHIALGFSDGSIRTGEIGFETNFLNLSEVPADVQNIEVGAARILDGGVVTRTSLDQFRSQRPRVALDPTVRDDSQSPIRLIDRTEGATGPVLCVLTEDGVLRVNAVSRQINQLTDEVRLTLTGGSLQVDRAALGEARFLRISGLGDNVFLASPDGRLLRYDTRNVESPALAEVLDLVPEPDAQLTALGFLLGRTTLLAGDSLGRVRTWFGIKPKQTETRDGIVLTNAHEFQGAGAAVTALASSARIRLLAAGYADGGIRLFYVTSERLLWEVPGNVTGDRQGPVHQICVAPKSDAIVAASEQGLSRFNFDPQHPEISFSTLFRPVWYEGYERPVHAWQSSSGTDKFEPKFGMMPLVFGTFKATFYSMLFGAPLALLAAIYTSQFLTPRARARIKPTIEMMASLPSVVLGFLAGLVIAPMVEDVVPSVLTAFFAVPITFLLGAHLWQMLPSRSAVQYAHWRFPLILLLALPGGIAAGTVLGPWIEWLLFSEPVTLPNGAIAWKPDFKGWLNQRHGGAWPGWFVLALPICGVATFFFVATTVNPWLRRISPNWQRWKAGLSGLLVFILSFAAAVLVAALVGYLLASMSFDPRGSIVDTYVQRNALVVGFVMGFAIIPIIYTIADDALTAVPDHLRSASLGAGATPWQTAVRIVIPTAMSGLFSALMIGLGRAVGETMIVLMAAGNTPIMEVNIFNGFQTLSANIATELPEAARGSTHYRTLFLAALTLFAMTFVVNTAAELVRQRFRKRAYEL